MSWQLTADDARQSLNAHVAEKGAGIFEKYGPRIGWNELRLILADRACVRYPCEVVFDDAGLQPGEFAHPAPKGERPDDGFTMFVHPRFESQLASVPALVLYQLVLVNYGGFASADDAETFGAAALGLGRDEYYARLCALADQVPYGCCAQHHAGSALHGGTNLRNEFCQLPQDSGPPAGRALWKVKVTVPGNWRQEHIERKQK